MKPSFIILLAPSLFAAAIMPASAAIVTDDFEGGLANWATSGDVLVQGSGGGRFVMLTTAFTGAVDDPSALNLSGVDPVSAAGTLDLFVGLALGALDLGVVDQATEGSAFKRTFSVTTGDTLSFDWQLATRETIGRDYAFVTIGGQLFTLGDVSDALEAAAAPYSLRTGTGLARFEYVFPTSGNVSVAFGVTDVGDYITTTALILDNVSIVPEPSAALLGAFGALALLRRRR